MTSVLRDVAPAQLQRGWLPSRSGWPKLGQLREEHVRLLAAGREAGAALSAVRQRHEGEDDARRIALQRAYRDGDEPQLPKTTPPEKRERELAAAAEHVEAAGLALRDFLHDAVVEIREHEAEWQADLDGRTAETERLREEAARLLAEAEARVVEVERMRRWLHRTATAAHSAWLIGWDEFPAPTPTPMPDLTDATGVMGNVS